MVNHREIAANLEKILAIIEMKAPIGPKEIQVLTKRIVVLSRFVSKSVDFCKHFSTHFGEERSSNEPKNVTRPLKS